MSLLSNMPHTGTSSRKKYIRDDLMGNTVAETTLATGVSAWVQNASMAEINEYDKIDERITHKVFFAADPSMRPGDIFTITAGPSFVGKSLRFKTDTERSAGMGVLYAGFFEEENNVQEAFSAS